MAVERRDPCAATDAAEDKTKDRPNISFFLLSSLFPKKDPFFR
jgi:hypothetical protein